MKISNFKDCGDLAEWIRGCENHLHWSATSTPNGNGEVIWAKFVSFLWHIVDEHEGFEDPLFNHCALLKILNQENGQKKVGDVYWMSKHSVANIQNKTTEKCKKVCLGKSCKQGYDLHTFDI